jgi:hypothetical protein
MYRKIYESADPIHSDFALPLPNQFALPLPNQFALPLPNQFALPLPNQFALPLPNQFALPLPNRKIYIFLYFKHIEKNKEVKKNGKRPNNLHRESKAM